MNNVVIAVASKFLDSVFMKILIFIMSVVSVGNKVPVTHVPGTERVGS
jgi:hypothetical protein